MLRSRVPAALGLGLALSTACEVLDPTFAEPGLIISYGDTAQVMAPDSTARGVPFEVSIGTFAGGCTREIARTEIAIVGMVAEIRPYNETRRSDGCTDDLIILTHTAIIQLDQPGAATIRVVGEQRPFEGTGTRTGPAELDRRIVVQ